MTADEGAIGDTHLRNFQDNDKEIPTILTTSQKLSTGVDVRNIRNIVLMRLVNSMIEFKQIIERGTRLFDGKYYFTIIDFVNAYHLFNDPEGMVNRLSLIPQNLSYPSQRILTILLSIPITPKILKHHLKR